MMNLDKKIFEAVKQIPRGHVATYGQIAELLGDKKLARFVGNVLHKNKNQFDVPCYRVVNAKGKLSSSYAFGGMSEQEKLLRRDGVEVIDGKVDLIKYAWEQNNRDNS